MIERSETYSKYKQGFTIDECIAYCCSGAERSGALRQDWIRLLPSGLVTNGCSLGVVNVYTSPVSDTTSSRTWVPVNVLNSYAYDNGNELVRYPYCTCVYALKYLFHQTSLPFRKGDMSFGLVLDIFNVDLASSTWSFTRLIKLFTLVRCIVLGDRFFFRHKACQWRIAGWLKQVVSWWLVHCNARLKRQWIVIHFIQETFR